MNFMENRPAPPKYSEEDASEFIKLNQIIWSRESERFTGQVIETVQRSSRDVEACYPQQDRIELEAVVSVENSEYEIQVEELLEVLTVEKTRRTTGYEVMRRSYLPNKATRIDGREVRIHMVDNEDTETDCIDVISCWRSCKKLCEKLICLLFIFIVVGFIGMVISVNAGIL